MLDLNRYDSFIFDCDGVLLDSNRIKTQAFRAVLTPRLLEYEVEEAISHHLTHGGISRYEKFLLYVGEDQQQECLEEFADKVKEGYSKCFTVRGASQFVYKLPKDSKRIVVSGGNQVEVVNALNDVGLRVCFDVVLGSPTSKADNCLSLGRLGKTIYFGDSKLDYELANIMDWSFVFVYGVSEFADWANYFSDKDVLLVKDFGVLF